MLQKADRDALTDWVAALRRCTATAEERHAYRQARFATAWSLGSRLRRVAIECQNRPLIYAVFLSGDSAPVYIGETDDPARRLYDLPVGESHHLANTYPAELWTKVAVFDWTQVYGDDVWVEIAKRASGGVGSQVAVAKLGKSVEHILQRLLNPEMNAYTKAPDGRWRRRSIERSACFGAKCRPLLASIEGGLVDSWERLIAVEAQDASGITWCRPAGCVVTVG